MGEHVERMTDDCLAKIVKENRPQGRRNKRRPKKRWKVSHEPTNVYILFLLEEQAEAYKENEEELLEV